MSENKGKYLSLALSKAAFPLPQDLPAEHHVPAGARTRHLLSGSLALLPSQSCQRSQTRCCFCWVGSLLFLLAEGSEMVQLWWL